MNYNQNPYYIFNPSIFKEFEQQQIRQVQEHHMEQQKNVIEMRKAIADYCNAARKISQDYWSFAMDQCMQELFLQAAKDGYNNRC